MNASVGAGFVRPNWTRTILCAVTAAIFGSLVLTGCVEEVDDPDPPSAETTYRVTVTGGTGGGNYAAGATVSVTANTPPEGQVFGGWTASPAVTFANASSAATTFSMPPNAVTVTANFVPAGGGENDITFVDTRGNEVVIPYGAMSCAQKVIGFTAGNPWTSDARAMNPNDVLGAPDYDAVKDINYLVLGRDGVIILEYGIHITDGPGNDIYVFEIGPAAEATRVEVSDDLENWIYVGDADGSLSGVDINGKVPAGAKYKYVRITDRDGLGGSWAGADIDAVAAMHPALE